MSKVLKASPQAWVESGTQVIPLGEFVTHDPQRSSESVPSNGNESSSDVLATQRLAETQEQARKMLTDAQAQVKAILDQAHIEADKLRLDARTTGYAEGYHDGQEKAQQTLQAWKEKEQRSLTAIGESMIEQRVEQLHHLEPVIEQFAIRSVRRLLMRELELSSVDVSSLVDELLQYVIHGTSVQVRVHPDDYLQARQSQPKWQMRKYGEWTITVIPDASLVRGDCEIVGKAGRVDGRLETRLAELEQALQDSVNYDEDVSS